MVGTMNKAQKYSVGLSIQLSCIDSDGRQIDISTTTVRKIKYVKPDGSSGEWSANILNLSNSTIEYITNSTSNIDQAGTWMLQAYVEFADGRKFYTTPGRLHVSNNIA